MRGTVHRNGRSGLCVFLMVTILVTGCNGDGGIPSTQDGTWELSAPDAASVDTAWDSLFPDAPPGETGPSPDAPPLDGDSEAVGPACEPGEGCFLAPCAGNGDCEAGWCVAHRGEKVCTQTCQEECPAGWTCQQVGGTDPDLIFVCVSDYPTLCRPCSVGDDCEDLGGAKDACLSYGTEGAFCGGSCGAGGTCPTGFSCVAAETLDGVTLEQCVADAGTCACTDTSVALGLWTACVAENEWGICGGKRVCEEGGLSDCDAPIPAEETCNALDDDCDGVTDEELCDDGNPCTEDQCVPGAGCSFVPLDGLPCEGEDLCAGQWTCQQGTCVAVGLADCDDGKVCTTDTCDPTDGKCDHVPMDGDCPASNNPCIGQIFCDPLAGPAADPDQDGCVIVMKTPGTGCSDGDLCTTGDTCNDQGGILVCTGAPVDIDDGNPCTTDSCVPETGPSHDWIPDCEAPCASGEVVTADCGLCGTHSKTCPESGKWSDAAWSQCSGQGICTPGASEAEDCGDCGTQLRTCTAQCQWSAWGACEAEGVCTPGELKWEACEGLCSSKAASCTALCQWGAWGACEEQGDCSPGAAESQACGDCGTQNRTCTDLCTWGAWGPCGGQGACAVGAVDGQACGLCGAQARTCTDQCQWGAWGVCEGQGACTPGAGQTEACGSCGTRSRTCSDECGWSAWGPCEGQGDCTPGALDSLSCGDCGAQTRTCAASCQWGSWGSCTGQGICTPGEVGTGSCGNCGTQSRTCTGSCAWGGWSLCDDPCACECSGGTCCTNGCDHDAFGTSCGECAQCNGSGSCTVDKPDGTPCPDGQCQSGACVCVPSCAGKVCGADGCGGTCGSCTGDKVCTAFGTACAAPVGTGQYLVGVDYHSTGSSFTDTAFLSQYHVPSVRSQVQTQLQGMADDGARIISTRIWMVNAAGDTPSQAYRWNFPPSQQQLENLHQYVQDVSGVVSSSGQRLELDLCLLYLWCAKYTTGSPSTTLGECGMSASQYAAAHTATVDGIIDAVAGIYRPDGQHAVARLYLDGEVMTAAGGGDPATQWEKDNQRWFLQTYWPGFTQKARAAGMIPMLYFLTAPTEDQALDNDFTDSHLPALNGHRSVYWIYRTLKFMTDNGLEIPARIDFSLYPNPPFAISNEATVINRVFDDLEATVGPLLGGNLRYGVAETIYYADTPSRTRVGKALAAERALRGSNPEFVTFWTTPYGSGQTDPSGYPFDIDAFQGDGIVTPFGGLNPSFESVDAGTGRPTSWTSAWGNGNPSGWSVPAYNDGAGAFAGSRVMRLNSGVCAGCSGAFDGVWVRSDKVSATPGSVVVARFYQRNSITPTGEAPPPGFTGGIATLLGYTANGQEKVLNEVGFQNGYWSFHRAVLVSQVHPDVVQIALRFGLVQQWSKSLDIDLLH